MEKSELDSYNAEKVVAGQDDPKEIKRILRKIDYAVVPYSALLYLLSFLGSLYRLVNPPVKLMSARLARSCEYWSSQGALAESSGVACQRFLQISPLQVAGLNTALKVWQS